MANANISIITTANVFNDWLTQTNNTANLVNRLLNGLFYADNGNLTLANGQIQLLGGTYNTPLSVTGNVTVSQQITVGSIQDTGSLTVQGTVATFTNPNVTVQSANAISSPVFLSNSNSYFTNTWIYGPLTISGNAFNANTFAPTITQFNEKAVVNVNSQILISNTGNTQITASLYLSNPSANLTVAGKTSLNTLSVSSSAVFNSTVNVNGELFSTDIVLDNTGTYSLLQGNAIFNNLTVSGNATIDGNLEINGNLTGNLNVSGDLIVDGTSDLYDIVLDPTGNYSVVNGNATINNLTVKGSQVIEGTTTVQSDEIQLRTGAAGDGPGYFDVWRGNTLGVNASIQFSDTSNNWLVTANDAQTYYTIQTTQNLVASFTNVYNSTDTANSVAPAAVWLTYQAALTNATAVVANNGTFVAQRKGTNFLANNILSLNVTANSTNTSLVDVYILANTIDSYLSTSTTAAATANAVNAAYNAAISNATGVVANNGTFVAQRKGIDFVDSSTITTVVTANGSNSTLTDVTFNWNGTYTGNASITGNITATQNINSSGNITATGNATAQNTVSKAMSYANNFIPSYGNTGTLSSGTYNLDVSQYALFDTTLSANVTVDFINLPTGPVTFQVLVRQNSTGGYNPSWGNTIRWSDSTTPIMNSTANTMSIFQFTTYNKGTFFLGALVMDGVPLANVY
jgi:cytoskeletal protein CcmA (bactofilin family)